jgi:hypothetical protein
MIDSSSITLADLLSTRFAPIQQVLVPLLDPADIMFLFKACKDTCPNLLSFLQQFNWNINLRLRHFFEDPRAFRIVQAKCDALIVRDFARQFFNGSSLHDLILYVDKDVESMEKYLQANGYTVCIFYRDYPANTKELPGTAYSKVSTSGIELRVRVLSTNGYSPAVVSMLQHCGATSGLSFMSRNKAYSLLPLSTFIKKETYLLRGMDDTRDLDDTIQAVIKSHEEEGIQWKTIHWQENHRNRPHYCKLITHLRRIGDRHTWTIISTPTALPLPRLPITCSNQQHSRYLCKPSRGHIQPNVTEWMPPAPSSIPCYATATLPDIAD